ncbi:choice-of-anchor I family protein [Serinibacter salmoneus]|uniref:choice-of-anchor I family protein n=1 Tax=Serinibacter salmoneus TaxID=556530 RepID=UPI000BF61103|nr:choice-of-anchor I family protein [Serinibacter salmoneus]
MTPSLTPRRTRALSSLAVGALAAAGFAAAPAAAETATSAEDAAIGLSVLGTYASGVFDESAAEIVAFHAATQRVFTVNAEAGVVDVIDAADPSAPTKVGTLATAGVGDIVEGAVANSIAVREDGLLVVAVEHPDKVSAGWLAFYDATTLGSLGAVQVGSLPDMVTITPDGTWAVVANEGEPADDYTVDPEGSIGVVGLPAGLAAPAQAAVRIADFHAYEDGALPEGVRVFGEFPHGEDLPVSRNLEPEYVTTDGTTAWVSLQENNAIAVVDIASATITDILPLGTIDHSQAGSGFDPSDRDEEIAIQTVPTRGLLMPDSISTIEVDGETYLVTANEGDAREWGDYVEAARVKDLGEDGFPPLCEGVLTADQLEDEVLGRLEVSIASGLSEAGCIEQLHSFGTRSFTVLTTDGELVANSGDDFEQITAALIPEYFNSSNDETEFDSRSDAKGPEPEAITVGEVDGVPYVFVGAERVGGIFVYDLTDPSAPAFVTYLNNRDFEADPTTAQAGDLGPEGFAFVPAEDSPTGEAMLVVGNEVSGTTTLFEVASTALPFIDVSAEDMFADEIHWAYDAGITTGWQTPAGAEYRPLADINRDAMAAFLYRLAGPEDYTPPAASPFVDVSTSNQFYIEISWLAEQGISTGWPTAAGAEFRPLEPINRDAMAAFLYRLAAPEGFTAPALSPFEDVAPADRYYTEISWLAQEGISTGWQGNDGTALYRPLTPIARDAMAAFLYRFAQTELPA